MKKKFSKVFVYLFDCFENERNDSMFSAVESDPVERGNII